MLHYSVSGNSAIGYVYDTDVYISKRSLRPGESAKYYTDWRQASGYRTAISVLSASRDEVEINGPFSRVDVYVGPDGRIERTETRHSFVDRFTDPQPPCGLPLTR